MITVVLEGFIDGFGTLVALGVAVMIGIVIYWRIADWRSQR